MATDKNLSTTSTRRSRDTTLKKSTTKPSFRVQSTPPLSIQQYLRSTVGVLPGQKEWRTSGKYKEPVYRKYLTAEVRKVPVPVEPVWHPPGKFVPENVAYFDAPSLRWSLNELRREMPEVRARTSHASTSRMSSARRSGKIHDT